MLKALLFDFGGVLAEEGFREGLKAIARKNRLDPNRFFPLADTLIFDTRYLTGGADEAVYWNELRKKTGIAGSDRELRQEVLKRFILRPGMIAVVDRLKAQGFLVAMLSDQTNWLDELDRETSLSGHFDRVFNSFTLHKSKRDASVFRDVCDALGVEPGEALFVDDNMNHIQRAAGAGLHTIRFTTFGDFEKKLCGFLEPARAQSRR